MSYHDKYYALAHAIQTGVKTELEAGLMSTDDKHQWVGIILSKVEHGAIAKILVDKGVCSEQEYKQTLLQALGEEKERIEQRLSAHFGTKITLG